MVQSSHTAGWWPSLYEPLRNVGHRVADWFAPPSDASAMKDFYEINVELPGVKPDEIDVSIHGNQLVVRGEKHAEREEQGRNWFFSERTYGAFERSFRMPADADAEQIDASFQDGVLCLKVAKRGPSAPETKKINIRSG